jgi:hypothetical protein
MIQIGDKFDHETLGCVTVQSFTDEIIGVDPESGETRHETVVEFTHMKGYSTSMPGRPNSMRARKSDVLDVFLSSVEEV